jgi:hypothetical protein
MQMRHWLRSLLAGAMLTAALIATPGLPVPGADRAGLGGQAAAQGYADIGSFYDELDEYGQWAWHPRFGYVWLPTTVSPYWRPYTVGRWIYSDYGWYWDSREPFAWAVYHYGRWGYDPDYGWFWVPGDVWAPAWVQWRYSDNYVGWAPIGPGRQGYAYGAPVSYEPSIAEAWVFVQPRYMTSRAIYHYALPIGALGPAFFSATTIYRPQFRGGVVYNYGVPRDRIARFAHTPIVVEKIYRMDRKSGWDRGGYGKGIRIYAPGITKGGRPDRGPKRFVDHPNQFRAKAKLKETFKGEPPKGWGPSAKAMVPIAKETRPDDWKKKWGPGGPGDLFGKDKDRDKDKGQAAVPVKPITPGAGGTGWQGAPGGPGGPDWQGGPGFQQGKQDDWRDKGKKQGWGAPDQAKGFDPNDWKKGKDKDKQKGFDAPGGQGQAKGGFNPDDWKRGKEAKGGDGGKDGKDGKGKKKAEKCLKKPDHPDCR